MSNRRIMNVRDIKLEPENFSNIRKLFASSRIYCNERGKEIMTKLLNNIGITKIEKRPNWNSNDLYFDEMTLIINPSIVDVDYNRNNVALQRLIQTKFYNISGWNVALKQNKIYRPLDNNIKRLMYNNIPIGDFYSDRNLLIVNFNMFPTYPALSIIKTVCDFIQDVLTTNNVVIENEVDVEKIKERNRKRNIQLFTNHIDSRQSTITSNVTTMIKDITVCNKKIIDDYHKIELANIELVSIKHFKKNFEKSFENQLKELEKMDFVKKVSLDSDGILIEIGNLSLGRGTSKVYIGYMSFLITPDEISILNKYSKKEMQHPHVNNTHPCFGTYSDGISKLLAKMDLKRLVFTLYQFLHTYTSRGAFSGGALTYWRQFRTREKRFDVDGNMLNKNNKNDKHGKN